MDITKSRLYRRQKPKHGQPVAQLFLNKGVAESSTFLICFIRAVNPSRFFGLSISNQHCHHYYSLASSTSIRVPENSKWHNVKRHNTQSEYAQ